LSITRQQGAAFLVHLEQDGAGQPLLVLHGFTGSARAWDGVRPELRQHARLVIPDLVGHGKSAAPDDPDLYTVECAVGELLRALDDLAIERLSVLGYSMGGRVALHLAVTAPDRVTSLLLESASPGIEDERERAVRMASDEALAQRIETHGVAAFVAEWEHQPLLALAEHVPPEVRAAQHAQRLDNNPRGLANSLRGMGAGRQQPLWSALPALAVPTHLLVGEQDVAPLAGHTVHLDQPQTFVEWAVVRLQHETS
jgi:2-succinyl-6-hydroxy-2,4-cyclohexadiene-1-carboxylate synthase